MALMIPDQPRQCGHGERVVFERLRDDLSNDCIVMHSLGLVEHAHKRWGEADFVVLSPKGIFLLEVKGGRVACRDGKWLYQSPGKPEYQRLESPWAQAGSAMMALENRLRPLVPWLSNKLLGYGVVMPHETFTATGPELEPAVLLDHRKFGQNMGFFIGALSRHWSDLYLARHGKEKQGLSAAEISELRRLLRPDVGSAFNLGSYFNGLETELIELKERQVKAVRCISANPRTVVTGRAGTGKTTLAVKRAIELAASGNRVLFLCFNQFLAEHLRAGVQASFSAGSITIANIHAYFSEKIKQAGLSKRLEDAQHDKAELFGSTYPSVFVDAAVALELEPFDVLVLDEAQDILTKPNIEALEWTISGGWRGNWHLFLDPYQNIYNQPIELDAAPLVDAGFARYELFDNCRNTRQVAFQTSIISGIDMALEGAANGPECNCIFFKGQADFLRKLEAEVTRLLGDGVRPADLVILSTRQFRNSSLKDVQTIAGLRIDEVRSALGASEIVHFSTVHAFKGLERKVVIAIDLDRIGEPESRQLHYVGLSRACMLLVPIIEESQRNAYLEQSVRFGERVGRGALK